jgi:hypothetical protein
MDNHVKNPPSFTIIKQLGPRIFLIKCVGRYEILKTNLTPEEDNEFNRDKNAVKIC